MHAERTPQKHIYAVHRRYVGKDIIYVEAESPTLARVAADDGDWLDHDEGHIVGFPTYSKAVRRDDLTLREGGGLEREDGTLEVR